MTVLNRQREHRVEPHGLAEFLETLIRTLPAPSDSVAVALVSDRRIRDFNRRFRGRDAATDVLSFPADADDAPPGERHLGDIVISVATAARQGRRAGRPLARELELLTLHGYLHLLGYDHEADDGTMSRLERRLVRRLFRDARGAP